VREEVQTNKAAVGRKLLDLPGYVFRVFVTNRHDSPLEIWRDYNGRATVECRIDSANFSEVRSLNKKCRMKSIDIAAQLRNLGFKGKAESLRTGQVLINRGKTVSAKISNKYS
jgi:hypothetical protein